MRHQVHRAAALTVLFAAIFGWSSSAQCQAGRVAPLSAPLQQLVNQARRNNPEIQAASREKEAAAYRVGPAGALDDPMLEAGVINLPTGSWSFRAEDMTMKMLGLSQRLPYPGKRKLRSDVASREVELVGYGYQETINRVVRDVRVAYYDLAFIAESTRLIQKNRDVLEQFLQTAESRYAVGQASQAEVLKAQTQLARMLDELIRLERERPGMEAELARAVGSAVPIGAVAPELPELRGVQLQLDALRETAFDKRPQLLGLQAAIARADKAIELARADYYPDFDVKFWYGQRSPTSDGMRRDDMVTLTVAINLPVWHEAKRDPKVAEAIAMRDQAIELYRAQQNEVTMKLRQQLAIADQSLKSARLYDTAILPQARLAVEAAFSAYKVSRIELLSLLDSQMTVLNYEVSRAQALASYGKALAEIDLIVGAGGEQP
jgi:outer membrane protein, heavy metal efflux system